PFWENCQAIGDFKGHNTKQPKDVSVKLAYTKAALIVGIKAMVPEESRQSVAEARTLRYAYSGESVEFMLDATGSGDNYFHFIAGIGGMTYFARREQNGYVASTVKNCQWKSAVFTSKDFWSVEIEIPYYSLEIDASNLATGKNWLLNAVHNHYEVSSKRLLSSTATGFVHSPGNFLQFERPQCDLSFYCCKLVRGNVKSGMKSGKAVHEMSFNVVNGSGRDVSAKLELLFSRDYMTKPFVSNYGYTKNIPASSSMEKTLNVSFDEAGNYKGVATLRDRASNAIICREFFDYNVNFAPLKLTLIDPHYRNAIFESQKLDKVRYTIELLEKTVPEGATIATGIKCGDNKNGFQGIGRGYPAASKIDVEFPVSQLPYGRMEIYAVLNDKAGWPMGEIRVPLRKLPFKTGEVWRGKDGFWRSEGKKFFILSSWGVSDTSFLPEYSVVLPVDKELNRGHRFFSRSTMFGISKLRAALKKEGASNEVLKGYREQVRKAKDNPDLFAYYLCDEPDCFGYTATMLEPVADAVADEDPYHPVLISTGSAGVVSYLKCGELNGFHCYPFPKQGTSMNQFNKIVALMDRAMAVKSQHAGPEQDIIYLHQGFNYGDVGTSTMNRVPTYEEYRNQNFMSFVLGAKGLLHYNRTEENYPELYYGLPELLKEEKLVGERAVVQNKAKEQLRADKAGIRSLVTQGDNGEYWLIVCNVSNDPCSASLTFAPFGTEEFTVLSEERKLAKSGTIVEKFTPYQVHIYTNAKSLPKLKSLAEITGTIEAMYAKLQKPGNLAWQRYEEQTLRVTASSNFMGLKRDTQALWHITDGITSGKPGTRPHGGDILTFKDKTPNQCPDHVQLEFKKPITAGKVVLYPVNNSLKDYEIQVKKDGAFVTVATVKDAKGDCQTVSFAPVKTDCVRLLVTATNGPNTWIYEMEVYEK
ncbi:MAG: discoidin domain-containing protein, partial [Victivallales bacterium]|nr:discoidin domain-containing protein [Victivallales bacterium]